jgi:glycogen debranching enzyme
VLYPVAPVEAQAYAYLALRLWSKYFLAHAKSQSDRLFERAYRLKELFNEKFVIPGRQPYLAFALDSTSTPLSSVRSSMGHTLWAAQTVEEDGELDSILQTSLARSIVKRLMKPDLFESQAGIRTLSKDSQQYDPGSYHNGSIWPHDNSLIADGFENFGFISEARAVRAAILKAVSFFKTPVELFVYNNTYLDYVSPTGQRACQTQAWSAAAILSAISYSRQEASPFRTRKREKLLRIFKKLAQRENLLGLIHEGEKLFKV